MRNPPEPLLEDLTRRQAEGIHLLLLSMHIDAEILGHGGRRFAVLVAEQHRQAAQRLVAEEYPQGIPDFAAPIRRRLRISDADLRWFGRGSWMVLALGAACIAVHLVVHSGLEGAPRSRMIAAGAISTYLLEQGQIWRLASAVFLHFDAGHLLSNMSTMAILGPPLARLVGAWRLLWLFLATGVLANITSYVLHPISGLKAGASGGIAGLLGAIAGQSMRPDRDHQLRPWIAIGALGAFYAMMIGFGPGRDNYAHVAGVVFGAILGRLCPPLPDAEPVVQAEQPSPPSGPLPTVEASQAKEEVSPSVENSIEAEDKPRLDPSSPEPNDTIH